MGGEGGTGKGREGEKGSHKFLACQQYCQGGGRNGERWSKKRGRDYEADLTHCK